MTKRLIRTPFARPHDLPAGTPGANEPASGHDALGSESSRPTTESGRPWRAGPWPQLCFMHVGKTAGTSVHEALTRRFDPARTYHAGPPTFDALVAGDVDQHDLVIGHFSHAHTRKFRPHRAMFSLVREPVDRVVSNYYFLRSWGGEVNDVNRAMLESARRYDLSDFLKDDHPQVRFVYDNLQTYTFASDLRAERNGDDPAVLAAALAHLDEFAVVGLTERVDDALDTLARLLHWLPFPPLARDNTTPGRPRVADLTARERDAIEERNRFDARLYAEVKRRFEEQWVASRGA